MNFDSFVLVAATADLADEPAAREHADAVEFRMDLADAPLEALENYDGDLPLLVTNRPKWEGGEADGGGGPGEPANRERLRRLATAAEHPMVEAVDVELASGREADGAHTIEAVREEGVEVVVSVHNFEGTPDREDMGALLQAAAALGDVGKLAVTAEHRGNALDLLSITHALDREGWPVATMAMGEPGRHTRALAPLYGSRIGYAPVDPAEATAPGQYDLATLRRLIDELDGN